MQYPTPPEGATIVRQSAINNMMLCPARQGYAQADGFVDAQSEPLVFGSTVHDIIADVLRGELSQLAALTSDTIINYANADLEAREAWSLVSLLTPPRLSDWVDEVRECLNLWFVQVQPELKDMRIESVEETFYMPLDIKSNIWLQGTCDLMPFNADGERIGIDWKTAGRGWKDDKAATIMQAPLYTALAYERYMQFISEWYFCVYNRQKTQWDWIPRNVDAVQVAAALKTALEFGKMMQHNIYPATPYPSGGFTDRRGWYCSAKFCGAWQICEYKGMLGDDKDLNEQYDTALSWQ